MAAVQQQYISSSIPTAVVQQRPRVTCWTLWQPRCLRVCVCSVHQDMLNRDHIFTSNCIINPYVVEPIPSYKCEQVIMFPLFSLRDPPRISSQPHSEGELCMCKRRFAPRAASAARYARSQGRKQIASEAGREVYDCRCKLTTCKCQQLVRVRKHAFFVGLAGVLVFARFDNTASCIHVRRRVGSRQLCLLACVVAL